MKTFVFVLTLLFAFVLCLEESKELSWADYLKPLKIEDQLPLKNLDAAFEVCDEEYNWHCVELQNLIDCGILAKNNPGHILVKVSLFCNDYFEEFVQVKSLLYPDGIYFWHTIYHIRNLFSTTHKSSVLILEQEFISFLSSSKTFAQKD